MANIFSLFGQIFIDNEKANASIKETTEAAESSSSKMNVSFSSIISGAAKVGAAVTAAATTIGAGLYSLASDTAATADEIDKGSQAVGFSAEAYQKWDYVLGQNGDSIDSLSTYVTKLTNKLDDAAGGSSTAIETFDRLGLSVEELQNMSREDMFDAVIKSLADMDDETERAALMADIFGNKSSALAATLNSGSEAIEELKDRAEEYGMVMSDEAVAAGVEFGDSVDDIKRTVTAALNTVVSGIIPVINKLLSQFLDILPQIVQYITDLTPVVTELADEVLPPLFELAETLLPVAIELIGELVPVVTAIIEAILPVVIELLRQILPIVIQIVEQILPVLVQLINAILPLLDVLTPILNLALSLITSLLTPLLSLITGILTPLISLLEPIINILNAILTPIITLLDTILTPLLNILNPIVEVINMLLEPLFELDNTLLSGLTDGMFGVLSPLQMFSPIVEYLSNMISSVLSPILEHISIVFDTFKTVLSNVISFIKNVFTGNWSGAWENIKNIFSSLWEGIKSVAKNILNGIIGMFESALNGIISFINTITSGLSKVWTWTGLPEIPQIPKVSWTRLKIGMDYVPYDDYPALLHKGERVLRAYENEEYTAEQREKATSSGGEDAGGGDNITVNVNIENLNGADKTTANEVTETLRDKLLEVIQELLDRRDKAF